MDFNSYQELAGKTNMYPADKRQVALTLGLVEESGEVAGKLKKYFRGDLDSSSSAEAKLRGQLKAELGDVLWYLSQLADSFGINLLEVAEYNIEKLKSRKERDQITGSGDER